eukprot:NODE_16296_length_1002_cov_3.273143.p1 GENE.NODE_16296_length_1002_cov_3.273143~~NODE_16296_length_1002_cov_3.273143.p1  ORF type:complete len:187 (-),score=40.37 NODE_16296_length_1002_cov_3.273143:441-980(-)
MIDAFLSAAAPVTRARAAEDGARPSRPELLKERSGEAEILGAGGPFAAVATALRDVFGARPLHAWASLYFDGSAVLGWHQDAFDGPNGGPEVNLGLVASFGAPRHASWRDPASGLQARATLRNGDVSAFTRAANERFQHSVPSMKAGPRVAVIVWCSRPEPLAPLPAELSRAYLESTEF